MSMGMRAKPHILCMRIGWSTRSVQGTGENGSRAQKRKKRTRGLMLKNADFPTKTGVFSLKKTIKNYCNFQPREVY